ncbi:MAG: PAS domain-containing sensor histidine kinase [Siculibacillus sp.]
MSPTGDEPARSVDPVPPRGGADGFVVARLRRLSIPNRIALPGAVALVAALVLALVLHGFGGELRGTWDEYRAVRASAAKLAELERSAWKLHREVRSFFERPDENHRTAVEDAKAEFTGALWRARDDASVAARADFDEFAETARRYLFGFDELRGLEIDVALLFDDEFSELETEMRERLDALDAAIRPGDAVLRPLVALAYDRFAEFRVELVAWRRDREPNHVFRARVAHTQLKQALDEIGVDGAPDSRAYAIERFAPHLLTMTRVLERLSVIADRHGQWLTGYVDGNRDSMIVVLERVVAEQTARGEEIERRFERLFEATMWRFALVAAAFLGLAWAVARAVTASIRAPLARLATSMSDVVHGDHERPIADLGAVDEIGAAARSLEVFRREVEVMRRNDRDHDAQERRWLTVLETSPVGIAVISAVDGRRIFRNRRWVELFGGRGESDDTLPLAELFADRDGALALSAAVAAGDGVTGWKAAMRRGDDARWWALMEVRPIEFSGRPAHILWVYDDTDRQRAADEMRAARDRAETALADLAEAQRSLVEAEKLAAIGGLVAGVAHEVNNPVGIGLTVASTLERRVDAFRDELATGALRRSRLDDFVAGVADAAGQLVANLRRAGDLVQSFKQVAVDRTHSERRAFDLADATDKIVASLRPSLKTTLHVLEVDVPEGLRMDGFPGAWGQVVTNLFMNALTHAFPNDTSGTMTITARPIGDDRVSIVFADDGVGMAAAVARRAFEPFFTTRRGQGGSGLGLHIVYNIVVHRLGGRVTLTTEPGAGCRFEMVLPLVAPRVEGDGGP